MTDLVQRLIKTKFKSPSLVTPEARLMEELNKQNREKYEKWLYEKIITDKILRENSYRAYAA